MEMELSNRLKYLVLFGVIIGIVVLVRITPLRNNPFEHQRLNGILLTWDNARQAGWVTVGERKVQLHAVGTRLGPAPTIGCRVSAEGRYATGEQSFIATFVAELLTVETCPLLGAAQS
jgi:hypothetical protein